MDFTTYKRPRQEYVLLPQSARTKNTRLRWWQPLNRKWTQTGPQWAIDNVLIGQCIYVKLFNYVGENFRGFLFFFAYLWECNNVGGPVFSFNIKTYSFTFFWFHGRGLPTKLYHKNWATANCNDSTVCLDAGVQICWRIYKWLYLIMNILIPHIN